MRVWKTTLSLERIAHLTKSILPVTQHIATHHIQTPPPMFFGPPRPPPPFPQSTPTPHSNPSASISSSPTTPLGGIISIGGPLPSSTPPSPTEAALFTTPILVLGGSSSSAVSAGDETRLWRIFQHVDVHRFRRPGDAMPRSRDEMLPVMKFLSNHLRSRKGVPEGSLEL